jgi:hypothetical protein
LTPARILDRVRSLGCDLVADGDTLRLRGPREARAELAELVRTNKSALLAYLPRPRPEPLAAVVHCTRVRPDSAASGNERAALVECCKTLPNDGEVDALLLRLFHYWRRDTLPSLTAFLAREPILAQPPIPPRVARS